MRIVDQIRQRKALFEFFPDSMDKIPLLSYKTVTDRIPDFLEKGVNLNTLPMSVDVSRSGSEVLTQNYIQIYFVKYGEGRLKNQ